MAAANAAAIVLAIVAFSTLYWMATDAQNTVVPIALTLYAFGAYGIWKMSRTAAVLTLAMLMLDQTSMILEGRPPGVMGMFAIWYLVQAIRGTFVFHSMKRDARPPDAPGAKSDIEKAA